MKVFLIGGTGYIGSAVATALADRGHTPVVLTRSAESKAKVTDARVATVDGTLDDTALLVREAAAADAVIYLAVAGLSGASAEDLAAIDAVLASYEGTGKSFVHTSGLAVYLGLPAPFLTPETDTAAAAPEQAWRVALEQKVLSAGERGVRTSVIRPSIVYGNGTASTLLLGLLKYVAAGNTSFFIGDGSNRIPTVHVADLAEVYVSALEKAPAGANYNVASGSILGYDLAAASAAAMGSTAAPVGLSIPEAIAAIGPAGPALSMDLAVSEWRIAADLDWSGHRDSLVLELANRRISPTR